MSTSETITRTDLTNILNEVLPPTTLNPWVMITATSVGANNTATKVTGTSIRSGGNASDYFDTSIADQIIIKRAGQYKVTLFFRATAITTSSNVKRISCYKNGTESCSVIGRLYSWEDASGFHILDCSVNDVLTMYRRAEDGGSTFSPVSMIIEALDATAGNISAEADYIVEQGTNNNWTYRKWNSGTYDAWQLISSNVAVQTAWGNWYSSATSSEIQLPSFSNGSGWTISGSVNGGEMFRLISKASTTSPPYFTYSLAGPVSRAASARSVSVIIHGTWK